MNKPKLNPPAMAPLCALDEPQPVSAAVAALVQQLKMLHDTLASLGDVLEPIMRADEALGPDIASRYPTCPLSAQILDCEIDVERARHKLSSILARIAL